MLYLTCTMISSVDLAYYRVSRAKDWVSVDRGTMYMWTKSFSEEKLAFFRHIPFSLLIHVLCSIKRTIKNSAGLDQTPRFSGSTLFV